MPQSEPSPSSPQSFQRSRPRTLCVNGPVRCRQADVTPRRSRTNFDGLRLLAALLVVYGHAGIDGTGTIGMRLLMFFAISGYLIAGSWQADPHAGRFLQRRFLRLWPAYAVTILLCAGLSAVFPAPDLPELSRLASLFYLSNLWFANFDWAFFLSHSPVMNKSIWMLGFEVDLYLAFVALALLFGRRIRFVAGTVLLLALVGTPWHAQTQGGLLECWSLRFSGFFAAGVVLRAWPALRSGRCIAAWVAAGSLLIAAGQQGAGLLLLIPSAAVWVGEQSWPVLRSASRHGDLSLGVFLWAWPLHQVSGLWLPAGTSPTLRFVLDSLLALAVAALSWRWIERPAQRFRPARLATAAIDGEYRWPASATSGEAQRSRALARR